jgi:hypothetical protein
MRLAAAVAFLIPTVPAVRSSLGAHEWAPSSVTDKHHSPAHPPRAAHPSVAGAPHHSRRLAKRWGRQHPQSLGALVADNSRDRRWGGRLAQLMGSRQLRNAPTTECDPTEPSDWSSSALGILTCSLGQYCVESKESSLGGYCVEAPGPAITYRQLQDDGPANVTLFDYLYQGACAENATAGYDVTCECTNVDRDANTLDFACTYELCPYEFYSQCFVNLTICFENEWTISLQGPDEVYHTDCYRFWKPYYQKVCYNATLVNFTGYPDIHYDASECRMDFNGVACNSCEVAPGYVNYSIPCYYFDCTNTDGNHSGNSCHNYLEGAVGGLLIASVYPDTYACVEDCNVCGDGNEMTQPSEMVNVSFDRGAVYEYECGFVSDLGRSNLLSMADCQGVRDAIFEPCGCTAGSKAPATQVPASSPPGPSDGNGPTTEAPDSGPPSDASSVSFSFNPNDGHQFAIIAGVLAMGMSLAASVVPLS